MKQCKKCGEWLEAECFYYHPETIDNLRSMCKECSKKSSAKRQLLSRERTTIKIERDWLKKKRKELGYTQRGLSEATGIPFNTYIRIERGYKGYYDRTSISNWNKIVKVLGEG